MSSLLYALGGWAFRARRLVLAGWLVVLALVIAIAAGLGTGPENTYAFPGTPSQDALDSLNRTFPEFSGTSAQLVAVAPPGGDVTTSSFETAVTDAVTALGDVPQVSGVTSPYDGPSTGNVAPDDSAVLVTIQLSVEASQVLPSTSEALQAEGATLQQALPDGSQVAVGGQLYSQPEAELGISEVLGLGIALVVLLFTFGALAAASMPLVTAVVGVAVSVGIVFAATRFITVTSTAPLLAVMLGLAVGVDYALFIISRHQDQVRAGMTPEESAPRAVATAGSAVVFAATTVLIALAGLAVARIPFLTITGISAALTVGFAALVALTLTPALLGFAGWRVLRRRDRPHGPAATGNPVGSDPVRAHPAEPLPVDRSPDRADMARATTERPGEAAEPASSEETGGVFATWVRVVTWVPLLTILVVVGLLLFIASPAVNLRLALPDAGSLHEDEPARVAYDLVSEHFGPGYNGPLLVTFSVIQSTDPVTLVQDVADEVGDTPGVALVPLATPNQTGDTAVIQVIPEGAPDSEQTEDLVRALRAQQQGYLDDYAVDTAVTGYTAVGIDISVRLGDALVPFGVLVVGLSLVLLMMVFRSVVVPVTAALGYLLSIAAALGVTSRVFIDGLLAGPLQVAHLGSVISFFPIILMGVLFGLAMDYEVFLVTRMQEEYVRHRQPRLAIERGFVASARVVTAAAIIMTAVFAGFIRGGEASIQPIALGLAVGVAIDAFVVRMTLIPAVLTAFGTRAWWLPAWLDRLLPEVDVEGQGLAREDALADWPEQGDGFAIAVEDVRTTGMDAGTMGLRARVRSGDVLVLEGGTREERRSILLALTGRLPVTDGRCKVAGLVLPTRAASVRARTAVVLLDRSHDPGRSLLEAALDRPEVLAVDGADTLSDPTTRDDVRQLLADARTGAEASPGRATTLVLACATRGRVQDLVPAGPDPQVLALGRASGILDPTRPA